MANSPGLAEIVAQGHRSYRELREHEGLRYGAFLQTFFDALESNWTLVNEHEIDKDLEVLESILVRRFVHVGVVEWWLDNTGDYPANFVAWVRSGKGKTCNLIDAERARSMNFPARDG